MKILACLLASTLVSLAAPEAIFDGKSLAGWKTVGADVWTVAEGALTGTSNEKKEASTLWTEKEYTSESAKEKGPIGLQMHPGVAMKIDFRAITVASE